MIDGAPSAETYDFSNNIEAPSPGKMRLSMAEHAHQATLVILGVVEHSAQLVAEFYQPAVFRAFFQRVQPDVISVERSPQEFLRGDYYEHS